MSFKKGNKSVTVQTGLFRFILPLNIKAKKEAIVNNHREVSFQKDGLFSASINDTHKFLFHSFLSLKSVVDTKMKGNFLLMQVYSTCKVYIKGEKQGIGDYSRKLSSMGLYTYTYVHCLL